MVGLALASFIAALMIPARGILGAVIVLLGLCAIFWLLQKPLRERFGLPGAVGAKVLGVLVVVALIGLLVPRLPVIGQVGAGFVPVSDRSEISMTVEAPPGSNLEYTHIKAEEAARRARAHREVAYTYTTVGTPLPLKTPSVDQALVYVRLVPKAERELSQEALGQLLRAEMKEVGGASISVFTSGFGGAMKSIQIQMKGEDARILTTLAQRTASEVAKVPGAVDVGLSTRGQKPELEVQLNRGLAGSLGITVGQVAQSLRPAFAGIDAGDWVDPSGETRDVTVRLAPAARERVTDLSQLPLVVGTDTSGVPATLPLGQVASIRQGVGPAQIDHLDRTKVVIIQANVAGRPLTQVTQDIQAKLAEMTLPPGYAITYGGESQDQAEVFTRIFTALGVAVLDPLAILVSLPLSLIGVVLALWVTRDTLNIMSLIGVILLMGIVAKNAILLIDFAKWARERGQPLREALIEAGRIRLRPIIMTTLALIAGMIPVAIGHGEGADFRAPLGRAVIGGTITSTVLTLLVIPTVYEILDELRSWVAARLGRRAAHVRPEPAPAD
jgi:HAE1 family hydrophobic/amphiphilic exporter-1